jgi:hypothetical protein
VLARYCFSVNLIIAARERTMQPIIKLGLSCAQPPSPQVMQVFESGLF